MMQRFSENKDLIIVAIASFFIGFGAASLFTGEANKGSAVNPQGMEREDTTLPPLPFNKETAGKGSQVVTGATTASSGTHVLVIENQRAGASVLVKKAEFSEAQWVVVRETNAGGAAGAILGAGWFPGGIHENVSVPLLRETVGGEQYKVELFSDSNGDKQFDHKTDEPAKDAAGNMIFSFFSTVASAGGE